MKIAFLFFLLIPYWCGAPASGAARHTVCLDSEFLLKFHHYAHFMLLILSIFPIIFN